MLIYLVRHGHREETVGDPALTELGLSQASKTGKFLKQFPIQKIVASPLRRTMQTAQQINNSLNLKLTINDLLKERINWENIYSDFQEFLDDWQHASEDRTYQPKTGNSATQAANNLNQVITNNSQVKNLVLVAHGGIISDFLIHTFGKENLLSFDENYDFIWNSNIKHCSITTVEY